MRRRQKPGAAFFQRADVFSRNYKHPPFKVDIAEARNYWLPDLEQRDDPSLYQVQTVPVAQLEAAQGSVTSERFEGAMKGLAAGELPKLIPQPNGRFLIDDGHHRIVKQMIDGLTEVRARVYVGPGPKQAFGAGGLALDVLGLNEPAIPPGDGPGTDMPLDVTGPLPGGDWEGQPHLTPYEDAYDLVDGPGTDYARDAVGAGDEAPSLPGDALAPSAFRTHDAEFGTNLKELDRGRVDGPIGPYDDWSNSSYTDDNTFETGHGVHLGQRDTSFGGRGVQVQQRANPNTYQLTQELYERALERLTELPDDATRDQIAYAWQVKNDLEERLRAMVPAPPKEPAPAPAPGQRVPLPRSPARAVPQPQSTTPSAPTQFARPPTPAPAPAPTARVPAPTAPTTLTKTQVVPPPKRGCRVTAADLGLAQYAALRERALKVGQDYGHLVLFDDDRASTYQLPPADDPTITRFASEDPAGFAEYLVMLEGALRSRNAAAAPTPSVAIAFEALFGEGAADAIRELAGLGWPVTVFGPDVRAVQDELMRADLSRSVTDVTVRPPDADYVIGPSDDWEAVLVEMLAYGTPEKHDAGTGLIDGVDDLDAQGYTRQDISVQRPPDRREWF